MTTSLPKASPFNTITLRFLNKQILGGHKHSILSWKIQTLQKKIRREGIPKLISLNLLKLKCNASYYNLEKE
jgi:hypothetical protein